MAIRMLESRFDSLTVNDENEAPAGNGGPVYNKSKVGPISRDNAQSLHFRGLRQRQWQ